MTQKLPVVRQGANRETATIVCKHFRTKGMYINAGLPPGQEIAGDGNCWCNLTQDCRGPDRKWVNRSSCAAPDRACFQKLLG